MPKTETIEEKVINTLQNWAKQEGLPTNITPKTNLAEKYNLNSLDYVGLVLEFEDVFDIEISDGDQEKLFQSSKGEYGITNRTYNAQVKNIIDYISKKI